MLDLIFYCYFCLINKLFEEFLKSRGISAFENTYSANDLFGKHYTINGYLKKYNLDKKDIIKGLNVLKSMLCSNPVPILFADNATTLLNCNLPIINPIIEI